MMYGLDAWNDSRWLRDLDRWLTTPPEDGPDWAEGEEYEPPEEDDEPPDWDMIESILDEREQEKGETHD